MQGNWTVDQYLRLETNHFIEFHDGVLEFLPAPTEFHQFLVLSLCTRINSHITSRGLGIALFGPLPLRLNDQLYRVPDVMFMATEHGFRRHNRFWDGADLVMEVVNTDDPNRDFEEERADYASAGIPEYWIIDPERREITVLILKGNRYAERGIYATRQRATSSLLKGFAVDVSKLFKAADAAWKSGGSGD